MNISELALGGALLFASGWVAGQTARAPADFVIKVDAPVGTTRVECTSGCELVTLPSVSGRMRTMVFECSGESVRRCSGTARGWLLRENPP